MKKKKSKNPKALVRKPQGDVLRNVAIKEIPPTKEACNAILNKRDGYCQRVPKSEGLRCNVHSRSTNQHVTNDAKMLYKDAVGLQDASRLESMIIDTQSMEGEIGVQKLELIQDLKTKRMLQELYHNLLTMPPLEPPSPVNEELEGDLDRFKEESAACTIANKLIRERIRDTRDAYESVTKRIMGLADHISRAVERNNKIIHGTKYTVSIQQLTQVITQQINILETRCPDCPNLHLIAQDIQSMKITGIGSVQDVSKLSREVPQHVRNQYKEELKRIKEQNEIEIAEILDDDEE